MSEPRNYLYTVHEEEFDRIRAIIGVRTTKEDAVTLADEAFNACQSTEVWIEEWDADGHWYDSTVVYRKERHEEGTN